MTSPDYRHHFLEGVEHFNAHRFWHAHESWEELWLAAETDLDQFLQGLIQIAAAYHHIQRGTFSGAVRLIDAALRRLSAFPDPLSGIQRSSVVAAAPGHRDRISRGEAIPPEEFPSLLLVSETESPIPPIERW